MRWDAIDLALEPAGHLRKIVTDTTYGFGATPESTPEVAVPAPTHSETSAERPPTADALAAYPLGALVEPYWAR